jgi:hypothetical protein
MSFQVYNPSVHNNQAVINALVGNNPGFTVDLSSVSLRYGTSTLLDNETTVVTRNSLSFYNGSIANLGIGAGLFLSSGDGAPPLVNTDEGYSGVFEQTVGGNASDPQVQAVANAAFDGAGRTEDTTILSFRFTVTDPNIRGIRFDVVYASDEYPEFVNSSYVDIGAVLVNGVNYALFNASPTQPLSIIGENLAIGNFINNQVTRQIGLEFDGISPVLSIVAPVTQGVNTIKIAVADTGDEILDSAMFISNLRGTNFGGFGLAPVLVQTSGSQPAADTAGNQLYSFSNGAISQVNFGSAAGNDVVDAVNAFVTAAFNIGTNQIQSYSYNNGVLELVTPSGTKQLVDVERVALTNGYFAFDTNANEDTWQAFALLKAGFDQVPTTALLSQWVKQADNTATMGQLGQSMLDFYAPGLSTQALVTYLYGTLAGITPTQAQVQEFANLVGTGKPFGTNGDLFAFAASLPINTDTFGGFVGSIQALDPALF